MNKEIKEAYDTIREEIRVKKKEIERLKDELSILKKYFPEETRERVVSSRSGGKTVKQKFQEIILNELGKGKPLRPVQLKEAFERESGRGKIKYGTFSSYLSTLLSSGNIRKIELEGVPTNEKYYYGLPEMFDGEKMKDEYYELIKKRAAN